MVLCRLAVCRSVARQARTISRASSSLTPDKSHYVQSRQPSPVSISHVQSIDNNFFVLKENADGEIEQGLGIFDYVGRW